MENENIFLQIAELTTSILEEIGKNPDLNIKLPEDREVLTDLVSQDLVYGHREVLDV